MSFRTRLARSVDRIPGYPAGGASWRVTSSRGHWGTADLHRGVIYVSPRVPHNRLYDVVAHEWSHVLSVRAYDGDVAAALAAMTEWFGGSGLDGAERAADCMARLLGAGWTHYTPCGTPRWRAGAQRLLAGERL